MPEMPGARFTAGVGVGVAVGSGVGVGVMVATGVGSYDRNLFQSLNGCLFPLFFLKLLFNDLQREARLTPS